MVRMLVVYVKWCGVLLNTAESQASCYVLPTRLSCLITPTLSPEETELGLMKLEQSALLIPQLVFKVLANAFLARGTRNDDMARLRNITT